MILPRIKRAWRALRAPDPLPPPDKFICGEKIGLYFPHVPKCAGTTVKAFLIDAMRGRDRLEINLEASARVAALAGISTSMIDVRKILVASKMAENKPALIGGHCPSPPSFIQTFHTRWMFITVLRDPVERWVSEFVYNTYKTKSWAKNDLPIDEFLETEKARQMGRIYLNYFSHEGDQQSAIDNLKQFDVLGFQDRMDDFFDELRNLLGDVPKREKKYNTNPNKEEMQSLLADAGIRRQIEELCRKDIPLYQALRNDH